MPFGLFTWRKYANYLARPALRRANVVEKPRFYGDRGRHADDWDWIEHGSFQRCQFDSAAPASLSRTGAVGAGVGDLAGCRCANGRGVSEQYAGLARAGAQLRELEWLFDLALHADGDERAYRDPGVEGHRGLLCDARRDAATRAYVSPGRRTAWRRAASRHQPRFLAPPLWRPRRCDRAAVEAG